MKDITLRSYSLHSQPHNLHLCHKNNWESNKAGHCTCYDAPGKQPCRIEGSKGSLLRSLLPLPQHSFNRLEIKVAGFDLT